MRLELLAELELAYDSEITVVHPFETPSGRGYGTGTGVLHGPELKGKMRWTNVPDFRVDDLGLPRIDGLITTDDGVSIVVSMNGYAVPTETGARLSTYTVTFLASDEGYRYLNTVLAVAEASVVESTLRATMYRCVNEC